MRINLKMKACCRRSRMMLDESVLYGQSGFQCWQSFCMCVNDAMHRAAPSRVPWWGTANLSCSVRPHSPARSSTKRKVSQRSQFVRLNPAWRRLSNSNPLSLSLPPRPQHQVKGRLGFSGILGDAFPAWASRWGCSRWWRGRGREPLLFLIQSRLVDFFLLFFLFFFSSFFYCLILLSCVSDSFSSLLPQSASVGGGPSIKISWWVSCPSSGTACSWHIPASSWPSVNRRKWQVQVEMYDFVCKFG